MSIKVLSTTKNNYGGIQTNVQLVNDGIHTNNEGWWSASYGNEYTFWNKYKEEWGWQYDNDHTYSILGTNDKDVVYEHAGFSFVYGLGGRDFLYSYGHNTLLDGGRDDDVLIIMTGAYNNDAFGGIGYDYLVSYGDNAYLNGGRDDDTLASRAAATTLVRMEGEWGNDVLIAGASQDRFIYDVTGAAAVPIDGSVQKWASLGADTIRFFDLDKDIIDFSKLHPAEVVGISDLLIQQDPAGGDIVITVSAGRFYRDGVYYTYDEFSITLENPDFLANELTGSNFMFDSW